MSYAAASDLRARFGGPEIDRLAADDDAGAARLAAALADAGAEIDAALAPVYALPLPASPLLVALACNLARARLYDDAVPEAVAELAKTTRATLRRLRTGEDALPDGAGGIAARRAAGLSILSAPAAGPVAQTLTGPGR